MWWDSATVVVPCAASPASTSAAPARMSCATTGAPDSTRLAADHGVVTVGAQVGAEPGQLLGEHEARLEDVLGDHRGAVADRRQRHRERLQVGREPRVGQRHHVERRRAGGPRAPGSRSSTSLTVGAGRRQLVQHDVEVVRPGRRARSGRRRRSPPRTPRCRPRSGPRRSRARPATQPVDPVHGRASRCETPSIWAPIATSISHRSMISGSRATLSMTVVPSASTAAISRFSVAPTLGKSSQSFAPVSRPATSATTKPCSMRTFAPELGQPGDVHVQAAGADVVAARQRHLGPAAAGDQRAEHADRGAQPADQVVRRTGARARRARRS